MVGNQSMPSKPQVRKRTEKAKTRQLRTIKAAPEGDSSSFPDVVFRVGPFYMYICINNGAVIIRKRRIVLDRKAKNKELDYEKKNPQEEIGRG